MSRYWSPVVKQLSPYVPGEQPQVDNLVKLNTNENPYGPSPKVIAAIEEVLDDSLRLYPDPTSMPLRQVVADYYGLQPQQVFVGNGSDEVLAHAFVALLNHSEPLLFPDITYSFYPVYCGLFGIEYNTVALTEELSIQVDDYFQSNGGIIFPNPNAPTGRLLQLSEIERLLQHNGDSVVVVDEAYIDFGGDTAIALIDRYPNLLVIQTLSKSRSLAGLRIGLAIGDSALIEGLERVKDSFNSYPLDRVALAAAVAAFQDEEYFRQQCQLVMDARDRLSEQLHELGFELVPSTANFLFARHPEQDAADLAASLRQQGVVVRHFRQPRIEQYLRITVGTPAENSALVSALGSVLS
jgi:histidinol-phosphate aminotransferase